VLVGLAAAGVDVVLEGKGELLGVSVTMEEEDAAGVVMDVTVVAATGTAFIYDVEKYSSTRSDEVEVLEDDINEDGVLLVYVVLELETDVEVGVWMNDVGSTQTVLATNMVSTTCT